MTDVQEGTIVDERFKILRNLGVGGMGSVFLVEQLGMERVCALKFLHKDLASDREYLLRFEREARILAELVHPNITRFFFATVCTMGPCLTLLWSMSTASPSRTCWKVKNAWAGGAASLLPGR